jgi:hypothetical protein
MILNLGVRFHAEPGRANFCRLRSLVICRWLPNHNMFVVGDPTHSMSVVGDPTHSMSVVGDPTHSMFQVRYTKSEGGGMTVEVL